MIKYRLKPRILIITPEVTYLPERMATISGSLTAKAGGLADVSAALINALFNQGADVHVAIPDYRAIFDGKLAAYLKKEQQAIRRVTSNDRVHLAEDQAFFYLNSVYSDYGGKNSRISLAFQREVINNLIPRISPDLIHCNDWMTGLIPAMAKKAGIPSLFTIHNVHSVKSSLETIEDRGIDAAYFWDNLYYDFPPSCYEEAREKNVPVNFLVSGVFAADFVNVVSPTFLKEIVEDRHGFVDYHLRKELSNKYDSGCAVGILNAPDSTLDPETDDSIFCNYDCENFLEGKRKNKLKLQSLFGLIRDANAPLFFWPSRLDPYQKGCKLLSDILYQVVSKYWKENLQIVFVANGEYQCVFKDIVRFHDLERRVAVRDFSEPMERLGYAASDFILMPSLFEPCGLPQMTATKYGSLPVACDTGGIHDTISHLDPEHNRGNGFLFKIFDPAGLFWAIDEAMAFYKMEPNQKIRQIRRIMNEGKERFNHENCAKQYIALYEKMLRRPVINPSGDYFCESPPESIAL
ncbi:MAG: glycogen/starch synthase [Desulfobacterales bacterium]